MKALILAAGLGTRLRPYTDHTPKPLFTVSGKTLLDITITKLIDAGCSAVIINTHHLHEQIEGFVARQTYAIPIQTRYEPRILGTGGAIKNVSDFWSDQPFMVVNADIVSTIDFKSVYDFHRQHSYPATLVLTDDAEFNSVTCDNHGFVTGFAHSPSQANHPVPTLTFTGIQVLNPSVLDFISEAMPASSIDAYQRMIAKGKKIRAYVAKAAYWKDIGTAERYRTAVFESMVTSVYQRVFAEADLKTLQQQRLKGDGSDRQWYRLRVNQKSMILADHGMKEKDRIDAADAFCNIGRHLFKQDLPVPRIYDGDILSGFVFIEDLGDRDLQTAVNEADNFETAMGLYQSAIDLLIKFSQRGADQFDTAWCYQTPDYNTSMILEAECRYFVDAFLNTYLGLDQPYDEFKEEFEFLAENALQHAVQGLMHRDFQSRNIMIKNSNLYVIDFQGARMGPLQYDLASLLIDPYVDLPPDIQSRLLAYCLKQLTSQMTVTAAEFRRCYRYCCLTRNLQMLGAFGFLTRVKQKPYFEKYIPTAVRTLTDNLKQSHHKTLPGLCNLMDSIKDPIARVEKNKD
ncbi:MAG: sugar phosphate nucleotidyltransferase [Desulfobacterales bacterium]|jgi:aminoglycoside/choline kinase family phosphotransferase/GTP:adenosylcobinamide-phosphate guanylyltransferase